MPETATKVGNIMTVYKYFGARPDEKMADFKKEWDALLPHDKVDLTEGIENTSLSY